MTLSGALKQAVRWGLLPRNVCDAVERPAAGRAKIQTLSAEQVGTLLAVASGNRLEALYVLAIGSGMRSGELFGLQWADVDLKAKAVTLTHTLQELKGKLTLKEPKTEKSRRRIDLPDSVVTALAEHRKRMFAQATPPCRGYSAISTAAHYAAAISTGRTSNRCWSGPSCRIFDSTICGTRQPRCCCRLEFIRKLPGTARARANQCHDGYLFARAANHATGSRGQARFDYDIGNKITRGRGDCLTLATNWQHFRLWTQSAIVVSLAEGTGFEPATGFPASDFESIKCPSLAFS